MSTKSHLLDDATMRQFIAAGYITLQTDLPLQFHDQLYEKTAAVFAAEGNPGNNLLPRIPEYQQIFADDKVRGALASILGPDYYMHPHRHCHFNPPGSAGQGMHKDSWTRRHHRTRWAMAFYYPQDVPLELGPTGIVAGTHYQNEIAAADLQAEIPLTGAAGTVTIVHYDLWHRAMPNSTADKRFMAKFLFARMSEPQAPTWAVGDADTSVESPMHQSLWNWHAGQQDRALRGSGRAAAGLIDQLQADDERACLDAAYNLASLGPAVLPELVRTLGSPSEARRRNAGYALSAMGSAAVPQLVDELASKDENSRAAAANVLGDIGLAAGDAAAGLAAALGDPALPVRRHAAESLGLLNGAARNAVPRLVEALDDDDEWVRRNTAMSLARLGPDAEAALPALVGALGDANRYVRAKAALALQRQGTEAAHQALLDFLATARWCPLTDQASLF